MNFGRNQIETKTVMNIYIRRTLPHKDDFLSTENLRQTWRKLLNSDGMEHCSLRYEDWVSSYEWQTVKREPAALLTPNYPWNFSRICSCPLHSAIFPPNNLSLSVLSMITTYSSSILTLPPVKCHFDPTTLSLLIFPLFLSPHTPTGLFRPINTNPL